MQSAEFPRVEARIEAMCQKGCRSVRRAIELLEQGDELSETRGLTPEELNVLLSELKQIMAVYGETCRID